jgi:hypothetical protein
MNLPCILVTKSFTLTNDTNEFDADDMDKYSNRDVYMREMNQSHPHTNITFVTASENTFHAIFQFTKTNNQNMYLKSLLYPVLCLKFIPGSDKSS